VEEPEGSGDVLKENESWLNLGNDAPDLGPEVALVGLSEPLPGDGMRLTREARSDEIHRSTPASAVEGGKVRPDSRER